MRAPGRADSLVQLFRRLGRTGLLAAPAVALALGMGDPRPSWAQAAIEAPTVEDLQRAIMERDAIISDLAARVGELERRLAITPDQAPAAATEAVLSVPPDAGAAPLPEPPAAPPEPRDAGPTAQVPAPAAPGQFEVDEEAVEQALERALVQTGALLLRPGAIEIEPSFSYTRREGDTVGPFLVVDDEPVAATGITRRQNALEAALTLRVGLPFESQLEVGVPYAYEDITTVTSLDFVPLDEQSLDGHGLGDVRVSLAKGLLRERGWIPNLIGRVSWDSTTGQTDDGVVLGSGFHEITGSLVATKRQDPLVFVGGVSYTGILERDGVDPGDELGFSLGTVLAASPETSLRFFLNQSFAGRAAIAGDKLSGSDQVSTSLVLGASSVITPRILLDVTAGIGLTDDAPDYSISASLPIRFDLPLRF